MPQMKYGQKPFLAVLMAASATLFAAELVLAAEPQVPATVEFNRDVRPILSDNCFFCHGPDAKNRKADLRLDLRDEAVTLGAIVPEQPGQSELVKRILSEDPDELMPPADSHKKLTAAQKEILQRWIGQGAKYQQHWAYELPVKAVIPAGANGVDTLIGKRLSEIG
ncbi:MAG: c-type cytochrome domain-containing protein, partial [Minisyncoccia bacterium]